MDVKTSARIIRKALKTKCKSFSVTMDRGTAYGWISIWGSGEFREFDKEEKKTLEFFGLNYGGNCALISPENRDYWLNKLCSMIPEAKALMIAEILHP